MPDDHRGLSEAAAEWEDEEADDRFAWAAKADRAVLRRALLPITPEWEAENIDWIRAKIQEALDDPRPALTMEEVDARAELRYQRMLKKYGR